MKKTLGGDRLGSGSKMEVDLHNYSRSTHDMGFVFRSTMSAGTLVPFLNEVALPGDTFDINLDLDIKTHPTVGPLFGSYKIQCDIFQCPIRLYQGQLHNNKLGIGLKMQNVKLPVISLLAPKVDAAGLQALPDKDNWQINPSCILAYLGIRGIGVAHVDATDTHRQFNGIPLLAYWDIYKNYYSNKQEEVGYVIHTEPVNGTFNVTDVFIDSTTVSQAPAISNVAIGTNTQMEIHYSGGTQPINEVVLNINYGLGNTYIPADQIGTLISNTGGVATILIDPQYSGYAINWDYINGQIIPSLGIKLKQFNLSNIDDMREAILSATQTTTPFQVFGHALNPYDLLPLRTASMTAMLSSQEGLGVKTYNSDLLNNWLNTETIDGTNGITEITSIDTSGGSFTLDTLNLAKKVYDMLNRIAVSGGTYDDWLDAVYTHDRYTRAETPMYMGGMMQELIFQEVVSLAEAGANAPQPLGTLAGRGVVHGKKRGGQVTIKVDEPSYIMGIVSLTPRLDYSQGNSWDCHLMTMDDLHKPALDEIGFQELITEQMAWWDTFQHADNTWIQRSAGKQPAWINYMTNINRVRGNFAIEQNEMFMVNTRRYTPKYNSGSNNFQIQDLTTYIDPSKYNHVFAQTSLDSQNYWTQIAVDMKVRRKISARIMPNL
jgi:hypothetical protein